MFFRCALNRKPMNGAEQNRPVKNDEQRKDYPNRNPNATPPFSLRPRILLLVIFHERFILWTAPERARDRKFERLSSLRSTPPLLPDNLFIQQISLFVWLVC